MKARTLAAVLTVIVFVNAALLFSVEPMFSKLVLPFLGGTPSVWNTCLVFFQAALLVGYAYAHLLSRIGDPRRRALIHIVLLATSCLSLPLAVRAHGDPPAGNAAILWLLWLLVISLGAPFLMLASGAPLAQRVLADSRHPDAGNPYFLYAASNFGSLIALLSYPIFIEPHLTLSAQRAAWSAAYLVLIVAIALAFSIIAWRESHPVSDEIREPTVPITARERASWILYSAVPASLLVGVTTFISTDVAAMPLLWVVPLSIYLLTFVIVFASKPLIRQSWMVRAEPHVLVLIAIPLFWSLRLPGVIGIAAHLIVLFVVAMVCHGELARMRPAASHLTEFFLWVALGGLVGGVFNALIAPVAFNRVYEYPIALALAGALLPANQQNRRPTLLDLLFPILLGIVLVLVARNVPPLPNPLPLILTILFGVTIFSFRSRPLRFGLALAALFVAGDVRAAVDPHRANVLDAERSFFGVYRVARERGTNLVTLHHGTTLHGAQSLIPARRLIPLTYYHPNGPAGDVFHSVPAALLAHRNVGVVGLGAGSLACYGHPGEDWTFYEIDPVVARIALDRRFFTFLRDCPPSLRIVLGDARLTLVKRHSGRFDILVLDAFSSDAIPVHLMTREAFQLYISLLAPHGVIAVHLSNEHLNLEPVVGAIAKDLRLASRVRRDLTIAPSDIGTGRTQSIWAILAKSDADFGALASEPVWDQLRRRQEVRAWTDDYSNIIRVFELH